MAPEVHDVAMLDVRRDLRYGVAFYRNQAIGQYKQDGVPEEEHVLVVPTRESLEAWNEWLQGRVVPAAVFLSRRRAYRYTRYCRVLDNRQPTG